jgi:hypothetical protein
VGRSKSGSRWLPDVEIFSLNNVSFFSLTNGKAYIRFKVWNLVQSNQLAMRNLYQRLTLFLGGMIRFGTSCLRAFYFECSKWTDVSGVYANSIALLFYIDSATLSSVTPV